MREEESIFEFDTPMVGGAGLVVPGRMTPVTTNASATMMTNPTPITKRFGPCLRRIGCHAAPFHQYLPSCDTQAEPSKVAGRPSGATIASIDGRY